MKSKIKRIFTFAIYLIGAISIFLLGVITERKWTADRMQTEDRLQIEAMIADSVAQAEQPAIDISELGFPEKLRESQQTPDERTLIPNHALEEANQKDRGANSQRETSNQPTRQNNSGISAEANRGLFIQIGAFKSYDNAKKAISSFSNRGFHAKIIKCNDPINGLRFKVRMGPFENHDEASVIITKLKQQNIPHFIVYRSVD
jgi:cell division septation protein DedD